jgi:hypothetical protein
MTRRRCASPIAWHVGPGQRDASGDSAGCLHEESEVGQQPAVVLQLGAQRSAHGQVAIDGRRQLAAEPLPAKYAGVIETLCTTTSELVPAPGPKIQ